MTMFLCADGLVANYPLTLSAVEILGSTSKPALVVLGRLGAGRTRSCCAGAAQPSKTSIHLKLVMLMGIKLAFPKLVINDSAGQSKSAA